MNRSSLPTRREFTSLLAGAAAVAAPKNRRPNFVFVCADQHDGRAVGAAGHPIVRTPNLDRLAERGVLFRNAYCGSPVCCPSRAGMMTGLYPSDAGSYCNSTAFDGWSPTFANRLREAGYYCWATGKLDLTPGRDYGFVEEGTEHGNAVEPDITSLFRRPVCFRPGAGQSIDGGVRQQAHGDAKRLNRALAFFQGEAIKQKSPWMFYAGLEQPKAWGSGGLAEYLAWYPEEKLPLPELPPEHLERMHRVFQMLRHHQMFPTPMPDTRVRRARAAYYARVSEIDAYAGRIWNRLEQSGQAENTVFIYTADHGEMLGEHGLWLKNTLLEGAARVPLILAGPGLPKGKVVDDPVTHADLTPTILELAGVKVPAGLRGQSLLGSTPPVAISECHSHGNCTGSFMVRRANWKYLYFTGDDPLLFDLARDPGELVNRAADPDCTAIREQLHQALLSKLDPDRVTEQAFRAQEARLGELVRKSTSKQFYETLVSRLGKSQSAALTRKYYPNADL